MDNTEEKEEEEEEQDNLFPFEISTEVSLLDLILIFLTLTTVASSAVCWLYRNSPWFRRGKHRVESEERGQNTTPVPARRVRSVSFSHISCPPDPEEHQLELHPLRPVSANGHHSSDESGQSHFMDAVYNAQNENERRAEAQCRRVPQKFVFYH